jgi:anti-sigma B factor antagonist
MRVTTQDEDNITIVNLQGKIISEEDTREFMDTVKTALLNNRHKLVLDFSGVDWINSSGLGMLIAANGLMKEVNGQMKVAAVNDSVNKLLTMNKLHLVLDMQPTVARAIESLEV